MSSSQKQQCVVITGSTRGIGLGLAKAFLDLGWSVVIAGRDAHQLQETLTQLGNVFDPSRLFGQCCDVTKIDELQQLWDAAQGHFGSIHVWINNAGSCHATRSFVDLTEHELQSVVQTNVMGTMLGSQVALKGMLKQGYGQIFNMEGWGSRDEWSDGMSVYSSTKRAVSYFSMALYKENRQSNVQIGTLSPGMVATELLISSWQNGNHKNWHKMKRLFFFVIDPPEVVCSYLAKRIVGNRKPNVRIVWMTPWRLMLRFFQPYYWRRNPIKGTALENLD